MKIFLHVSVIFAQSPLVCVSFGSWCQPWLLVFRTVFLTTLQALCLTTDTFTRRICTVNFRRLKSLWKSQMKAEFIWMPKCWNPHTLKKIFKKFKENSLDEKANFDFSFFSTKIRVTFNSILPQSVCSLDFFMTCSSMCTQKDLPGKKNPDQIHNG